MKRYNFKRLIQKYSVPFTLCRTQKGGYVSGKWEPGEETTEEMCGAIVPISERKLYDLGGTYTEQDRELYLQKPLEAPLSEFRVIYKGNTYAVESGRNYEEYADAVVYMLKFQSKKVNVND